MIGLLLRGLMVAALILISFRGAHAARPSAADALQLKPIQPDVDFDIPDAEAAAQCTIEVIKSDEGSGWHVKNADGQLLRRFLDTNGDNKVDLWCYYKNGIEVYRDIDSDFNQKADQYRWLGTAGTRWGEDLNEDGVIDRWKVISPEEVTAEVVAALSNGDEARFRRVLLSRKELEDFGLSEKQAQRLAERVTTTADAFRNLVRDKSFINDDTKWVNFGGTRPGIVPAGTDGSQRDLEVYENVAAVVQSGDTHSQIVIGTLVRVDRAWRVIDVPRAMTDDQVAAAADGFFFTSQLNRPAHAGVPTEGLSSELRDLVNRLEAIDRDLSQAMTLETLAPLNTQRADVLEELAAASTGDEDRAIWLRQLADTTSAAAQSGGYPDGVARLEKLVGRLTQQKEPIELVAYVKYRALTATYTQSLQQEDADYAKIQEKWLRDLEQFVEDYPTTADAADAMLQLAIAEEFADNDPAALKWYRRVAKEFPGSDVAEKAAGAQRRLEAVGHTLSLEGTDTAGSPFSLASLQGKVVIVHYWATWWEPFRQNDLIVLEAMLGRYGKDKLALVGINVDSNREAMDAFLAEHSMSWTQLHAEGGMDSPLARQYGVLTLPTMFLVDQQGKVISRNLRAEAGQIDREIRKLVQ